MIAYFKQGQTQPNTVISYQNLKNGGIGVYWL